jgi:hypothetical protein
MSGVWKGKLEQIADNSVTPVVFYLLIMNCEYIILGIAGNALK